MTSEVCKNCERPGCLHHQGGRSEAAYQDCIAHTAARADAARSAVVKAGRDPEWAAIFTWMDQHADEIYKDCFDENGQLRNELAVAKTLLKEAERDRDRAIESSLDLCHAAVERDQYKREARSIVRVGDDHISAETGKVYQLCACGWLSPLDAEICGNAAHTSNIAGIAQGKLPVPRSESRRQK